MIPALILFLIRRYKRYHPDAAARFVSLFSKFGKPVLLFLLCIALSVWAYSQNKKLEYQIKRKGDVVGNIVFTQYSSGNKTIMKMQSEVKTRFIFLFTAKALEETIYENGIMIWSFIHRKLNGNEKANKKTEASGSNYIVSNGDDKQVIRNYPIRYNMLSLYAAEPTNFSMVYSDNFQVFLIIQKIAPHHYKIKLPDGNYNEYFYSNGVCTKVEVNHSLYSATIELKK
jgi:uncharacterized protein DUF6134